MLNFSQFNTRVFLCCLMLLIMAACSQTPSQAENDQPAADSTTAHKTQADFAVIAYYTGTPKPIAPATLQQLTHIIYSFAHLKGNTLSLDTQADSSTLVYLVALKKEHPHLKIMLALGGWGGCETCSSVFATPEGREEFAQSTKLLLERFGADGLDLDWEYPTIAGHPGHAYQPQDRENFSLLVETLRKTLGNGYELSFAAGGFTEFLKKSVDWHRIMPLLDRVNLMSYDLVNGNSTSTGHHTPLYATPEQKESTDHAVHYLDSIGIASQKIVIGAAFYARVWDSVPALKQGLYQTGRFKESVLYRELDQYFANQPGFQFYWDSVAQAPYAYNARTQTFATYDNASSLALKTQYAKIKKLGGIMFWQLSGDGPDVGLLQSIHEHKK